MIHSMEWIAYVKSGGMTIEFVFQAPSHFDAVSRVNDMWPGRDYTLKKR